MYKKEVWTVDASLSVKRVSLIPQHLLNGGRDGQVGGDTESGAKRRRI